VVQAPSTSRSEVAHSVKMPPTGKSPSVSVIVPVYNTARYIAATLDSVLAQTFTDFEVIVINDGSPDTEELESVLDPYRERIIYLKQENRGVSAARNAGIGVARGEFLALLDSDDIWESDYLAVQIARLRQDPTIDVLYPDALIFGETRYAGRTFMDLFPSEGEVTFERLSRLQCNVMVCVTARRDVILKSGLFDESLRGSEDFDLWLRIVKQGGRIAYIRQVLARYRYRPGSLSSDVARMSMYTQRVADKAESTLTLTPAELEAVSYLRDHAQASVSLFEGKRAFFRGDTTLAISELTKANTHLKSLKLSFAAFALRIAPRLLLRAYETRDRLIHKTNTKF
jgi:glycosyltransferase involved in cell wall biosynthesis